ncbi:MAG: hypothetical protein J7J76_07820 [Candidatus Latescibacteria bacterium]|nr:hypothetical protein [Candidatus Latescibacterota bacterium]
MFEVKVDGQQKDFKGLGGSNFGEVMDRLCQEIVTPNRVITAVKVNGEEITSEMQSKYCSLPTEQLKSIEMETATPEQLIRQNLLSAADYLTRLIPAAEEAAEMFRLGEEAGANELYAQCVEGFRWLVRLLGGSDRLQQLRGAESLLGDHLSPVPQITDEMFQAQKGQDWVMLADLLEYELIPLLKQWQEAIPPAIQQTEEKQECK